ncbi:MAG: phosphoadenosine phosphosulfate reductase [Lysobacterales bacterium]|jgi:phosphoadenosine phosphosulfate reductase
MSNAALKLCVPGPGQAWNSRQLESVAPCLEQFSAQERVQWALDYLPGEAIMTSSFGAQSAVMLHMLTRIKPDIPVVLIDTGYLFAETYEFIQALQQRLSLNLKIFSSDMSTRWQENRFGKLWEKGLEGIEQYNQINKVTPMARALDQLHPGFWFSGLRRTQSSSRNAIRVLEPHGELVKVHPIVDWTDRDVHNYLKNHELPYHPLRDKGYVSIGDYHTSHLLSEVKSEEDARFFGLVRECGLHQPEKYSNTNPSAAIS